MLNNKPQPIGLKELISNVKLELLEEQDDSKKLFAIGKVELEITFTVERTLNGGIDFKVVQSSAEKTMTDVQTIKLTLEPLITPDEIRQSLSPTDKQEIKKDVLRGSSGKVDE